MSERLIVDDSVSENELGIVAYARHWPFLKLGKPPESPTVFESYKAAPDTTVTLVEDPIIGLRYIVVSGPNAAVATGHIRRTIKLVSRDAILAQANDAAGFDAESQAGRRLLAVAGESFDPHVFALLDRKFFSNPDPRIRADMIKCFSYAGWKELRPLIERLAASDSHPDVKAFARTALAAWDAESVAKSPNS